MMGAFSFLGYRDWGLEFGVWIATELALTWICCPELCFGEDAYFGVRREEEQKGGHKELPYYEMKCRWEQSQYDAFSKL